MIAIQARYTNFKELAEGIQAFATAIAVIVGGGWAFWRFLLQREGHSRIEFNVELDVLGQCGSETLADVVAVITNRGSVRHWIKDFHFDALYLGKDGPLAEREGTGHVAFRKLIARRHWVSPEWEGTFIDPGVTQRYTYVTHFPPSAAYVLIYAKFNYPDDESAFHTAQRTFKVPAFAGTGPSDPSDFSDEPR